MANTDKAFCRETARLLAAHGVRRAVLCPGSRNAPLIVAIGRQPGIEAQWVVDERSAAFIALGMASISGSPVALVCTSGSAVLNFAPAVAEAYYRRVPLIVISADRPAEWIDQDDSQTIRQAGVLANIVKSSCDVPVETGDPTQAWHANRIINDALLMAAAEPQGPVHINIGLDVPLGRLCEPGLEPSRRISIVETEKRIPAAALQALAAEIDAPQAKTLVIAGFMPPSPRLAQLLSQFAGKTGALVMTEAQANLGCVAQSEPRIDSFLSSLDDAEKQELLPDLVITIGGSLVSRFVKKWLRDGAKLKPIKHWHIGSQPYSVDCFMCLDKRIDMPAADFFAQLLPALGGRPSGYAALCKRLAQSRQAFEERFIAKCPWSDFRAMMMVMGSIPQGVNLQLSNGTAVRYAQLFGHRHISRIDCNRGVSGIDGCASTAVGASLAYAGPTLLVTGDMSMQYDIGALAANCVPARLKIAVLNNGGGGIFRFVESTAALPEFTSQCACRVVLPLRQLAQAYSFDYYEAANAGELSASWPQFMGESTRPTILNIITPAELSAECLKSYFARTKF